MIAFLDFISSCVFGLVNLSEFIWLMVAVIFSSVIGVLLKLLNGRR